jgi:hypothetical protein
MTDSQALFQLSEARKLAIFVDRLMNPQVVSVAQTGLQVTAYLDRRLYPCGLKPTPDQVASLRLQRHETLSEWNYPIKPQL